MNQKLPSKELLNRLKRYSLAAGAVAMVADQADANIIYTDVNPDFAGASGSQYFLDLNNDNIDDFRIYHDGGSNLFIEPLASSNDVLGTGGANYAYPYAMSANSMISASATGTWFNNGYSSGFQSLNYGSCSFGNWCTVADKYVGLRFEVGGNIHYGWARLDVNGNGSSWIVKDYAYDDVAGQGILAGASSSPSNATGATNVLAADVADNSNGSDLNVSFDAGSNESTIDEYRIMAVPNGMVSSFTLGAAQAVIAGDYTAVTPNASPNYSQVLSNTATDVAGNAVTNGQPYRLFILAIADGTNATGDSLSAPSDTVTLFIPNSPASAVSGVDIDDTGNGSDLQVNFTAAANETGVGSYRVLIVKDANAGSFDAAAAQAVPISSYSSVTPTGASSYQEPLTFAAADVDGDFIVSGEPYQIFVMSIADGVNANNDTLSAPSGTVTLHVPSSPATNIVATDVADNNDGTDLEIAFDAAVNENRVGEYRIMVVKSAVAGLFDIAAAQAVATANYSAVVPNASTQYTQTLGSGANDTDGDAISVGQSYNVFVMSQGDGSLAITDTLSTASDPVTLNIQVEIALNLGASDAGNNLDASDLEVTFDAAADEFQISEYRALVVKNGTSIDLATAETITAGSYSSITADGSASYSETLAAATNDVDGDAIAQNTLYKVYIMSVANGTDANINALSAPSTTVELDNTIGISGVDNPNLEVYSNGKLVNINGMVSGGEAVISVFNLEGRLIDRFSSLRSSDQLDLTSSSAGVYLIQVNQNGTSTTRKVSVQ